MTEQQMTEFDRWFDQFLDPELNLTPGDKELCRHAWKAALSHAEGEAVDHWAIRNPGLADQFRAEAQTVRKRLGFEPDADDVSPNDLRERIDKIEGAPQVAVPEPVGWVKWFGDEPSFQPRDALLPEDAKQHGWQLVGLMRSMNAPTAPAGEPECCRSQPCKRPGTGPCDMPAAQQPVSDPDGFEQVLEELRRLHAEMTNADLVGEGSPEIVGYCITGKQLDRMEWLLTCCASAALSTPAPDEREIAALALERHADNLIVMAERDGRNSDRESQQTWEEAAYFAKQEAARLRAGKGDE